jgi:hypothetical protein
VFLAQSYARAGQAKTALALMDEALVWMEQTEVRLLEAEAHRLRGEILLVDERSSADAARLLGQGAAEVCFQRAIDIARQQGARWWELRAVVSLYRLLKERGPEDASRVEARRMLAEIYGWHGEGFDTRDLQEARELLQE